MAAPALPNVLCVCTGNVCRSPAAERLLQAALGPTVSVHSAGTYALVGSQISPPMDQLITDAGARADGFSARSISANLARSATLVLALTREHRSAVVELAPAAVRRTFTLTEYARLLTELESGQLAGETPGERLVASVRLVAARRRRMPEGADDVADPYRRGDQAYADAFSAIHATTDRIRSVLNRN